MLKRLIKYVFYIQYMVMYWFDILKILKYQFVVIYCSNAKEVNCCMGGCILSFCFEWKTWDGGQKALKSNTEVAKLTLCCILWIRSTITSLVKTL